MGFFDDVDEKTTKQNVKKVLSRYRLLVKVIGTQFSSKVTATYSFEPRSETNVVSNAIEKHIVRVETAVKELEYMEQAINSIYDPYLRRILVLKYCDKRNLSDVYIYTDLGYEEREFYRLMDKALYSFAECYKHGSLITFYGGAGIDDILSDLETQ